MEKLLRVFAMKCFLVVLVLVLLVSCSRVIVRDDLIREILPLSTLVTFEWDAPYEGPVPEGYKFHWGTCYPLSFETDVDDSLFYICVLDPAIRNFYAVSSYNLYGESDLSNSVTYPLVEITRILYMLEIIQITWRSVEGDLYRIESSVDLVNWNIEQSEVPAVTGTETSWLDVDVTATKFYRVILLQ